MDPAAVVTEEQVRRALATLKERLTGMLGSSLVKLALYGSRARGDYDPDSDIDVAVIVRGLDGDLKRRIFDAVAEIEVDQLIALSTLVISEADYQDLLAHERRIALDIEAGGHSPVTKANKEVAIANELLKAEQAFTAFGLLVRGGVLSDAVSRLYYCLFHRVKALLLTRGLEPKSHEGTLHWFSEHFVKAGPLATTDSQFFASLMKYREEADYSPSFVFTESDVSRLRDHVNELSRKIFDLIRAAGFQA